MFYQIFKLLFFQFSPGRHGRRTKPGGQPGAGGSTDAATGHSHNRPGESAPTQQDQVLFYIIAGWGGMRWIEALFLFLFIFHLSVYLHVNLKLSYTVNFIVKGLVILKKTSAPSLPTGIRAL